MEIKHILINDIKIGKLEISDFGKNDGRSIVDIEYSLSVAKFSDKRFILKIDSVIIATSSGKIANIKTETIFNILSETDSIHPVSDSDFSAYAELCQVSSSHSRAHFIQQSLGTVFENIFIHVQRISELTILCKDNALSWWN